MTWRTYGNDAELAAGEAQWRKSSFSTNNGECAEAGSSESVVVVRDTMNRRGGMLMIPAGAWQTFVDSLK
jgi:hypothetical protein